MPGIAVGNQQFEQVVIKNAEGARGVVNTVNTTPVVGTFSAIQLLEDTVFSALTESNATGGVITGRTLPAGLVLYGAFTGYTLTSGAVRAYV